MIARNPPNKDSSEFLPLKKNQDSYLPRDIPLMKFAVLDDKSFILDFICSFNNYDY
jgi:hypothetical protein